MAKKSDATKNSSASSNDKKKKRNKKTKPGGPTAVAMKQPRAPKPNPFETIWSRRKFDVLGKKRKGEEQRIGLARSTAIRKATSYSFFSFFVIIQYWID
ncbi:hypothetical protein RHMOL_Rhmol12G0080300 [Rhododendron molle]|uniref:Uncharacterized protein n=1 Tax=Rhododendron molle TaxID=49168 RepID=A0ACC0LGQ2_RHOML|nr:hypothetical protein RHMOL_Rhmol12G0080300 [Rhododendron molle]